MPKTSHVSIARLIQRRDAWMKKLAELGPMTRGSLVTAQRSNHTAHQLTVSVQGKTHTVYVPKEKVEEVREWIKNHRRLQRILKEVSKLNMAIIHRHVPESRGVGKSPGTRHPSR
jgi:integrase